MHNIKRFVRWLVHKLSVALLANAVAVAIPLYAFGIHVTNPDVLKDWLARTNTYQTVINESLNLIELDAANAKSEGSLGDTLNENPFINPDTIVGAMRKTLSPEYIQSQTENFLDGTTAWLDGKTERPIFTFSLAEKQNELEAALSEAMVEEFKKMPKCLPEELQPEFNLLETLCQPPGVDIEAEVQKLVAELAGDEGILSSASWNGDDLIKDEGETTGLSQDQVSFAKAAYSGLKDGPAFMLLLGLVSIPLIFISSKSHYKGFNEVGNTLFSGSLFVFIPALIIARWENVITNLIGENNEASGSTIRAARAILEPFVQAAVGDVARLTAVLSGVTLLIGGLMILVGLYYKRQYREQEENEITESIQLAQEKRKISAIKRKARKHQNYKSLTKDPVTKKPLKPKKEAITIHHARKIVRDPSSKKKKISELDEEIKKK